MTRSVPRVWLSLILVALACSDPVTIPPSSYTVTVASQPATGGAAVGGNTYPAGASVTVTASPASGYTFVSWTEGTVQVSTSPTYMFTAGAHRSLVANFALTGYMLNVAGSGMEDGTVTSSPAGISCQVLAGTVSGSCSAAFDAGTTVTLTAQPAAGHSFTGWAGACGGEGSCTVGMTQTRHIMAGFGAQVGLMDGEHFTVDGSTRFLVHGGHAYRYPGAGTFRACTGNYTTSPAIARQLASDPGLPLGGVLPNIRDQHAPFSTDYWRFQWMSGRVPVRSTATGAVYVVVGCVKSQLNDVIWDEMSGNMAIDEADQALLDALPEGPPATAPLRQPGQILMHNDHEAYWVTGPTTAYRVTNLDVLRHHCNVTITRVSEPEMRRYSDVGILPSPMQPCASAPDVVLKQPDFRLPVPGGRDWQVTRGFSTYIATAHVSMSLAIAGRNEADEVLAAANGTVERIVHNTGPNSHGLTVTVRHDEGDGRFLTYYARLAPGSVAVQPGQRVARGDVLGRIGDVGYAPGTPFLHFELWYETLVSTDGSERVLPALQQVVLDGRRMPEYIWSGTTAAYLSTNSR